MATTAINTLRFARRLKDAGVPDAQAEAMADALGEELVEHLVTKSDLEHALATLETRLTWRLFVAAAAIIGIIISVLKLT